MPIHYWFCEKRNKSEVGFLIVIAVLALSCWILRRTWLRLRVARAGRAWWIAFATLIFVGLSAGSWLTFSFEYQVSARYRFASFPIPLAVFHLEDGQWIDFITPPYVMYPGFAANIMAAIALVLLPLLIVSVIRDRRGESISLSEAADSKRGIL